MQHSLPTSTGILADLIAFDTTSALPNRAMIDHLAGLLRDAGAQVQVIEADASLGGAAKANLYATVGPTDRPGVLLSGHTDVVPVEGQAWTVPPFALTQADGRLYGRGTADMKGFVACAVACALRAAQRDLKTPLHLAFSHDEEIGCIGVHSLIGMLDAAPFVPALCIVGEPTEMAVAVGHKGKLAGRMTCIGVEGHSALAPRALNAIHLAAEMVAALRDLQADIARHGARDGDYDVPYTTVHVGRIGGGIALNIVPNRCTVDFEIRTIAADDAQQILARIEGIAEAVVAPYRADHPTAAIGIAVTNRYPGLDTAPDDPAVAFVKALTGANGTFKVAFGTEGGLFSSRLGIATVVCGPGSMAQGHKPDEFVSTDQIGLCDTVLGRLVDRLCDGI